MEFLYDKEIDNILINDKSTKLDSLDKQYKLKKFLKLLFDGDVAEEEKIRIFQQNKEYSKVLFFKNIDDIVKFTTNKYININNTYFQLATIKEEAQDGKSDNLAYRYFLAFDFDQKEQEAGFNSKDVLNRFKALKLHYHAIVDSGHGYHVYICINKTNDFEMVQEVQEAIAKRVGADLNAIKSTQILRVPYTFNIKYSPLQMVNIIKAEDRNTITRYDINFLYEKNCIKTIKEQTMEQDTNIKFTLANTNIPICVEEILRAGSTEGERYSDLQKIVVILRQRNKSLNEIKSICKEWSIKSSYEDNLDYRIENIYNNLSYVNMNCKECSYKKECYNVVVSDFDYKEDERLIQISETVASKLKKNNRRGVKIMKSNDLLVYSILKLHEDGLTIDEILKELTYSKKKIIKNVALSEKTLRETLKSLQENGFIKCVKGNTRAGIKNLYIIKKDNCKIDLVYNISFSATFECVKGNISTEELRLYNYMRYLHHKEQREKTTGLKGNLFQINQDELAKDFGVTQGRISQMLNNLIEEKLLSIWYRQKSKNNGYEFNIYRLNY